MRATGRQCRMQHRRHQMRLRLLPLKKTRRRIYSSTGGGSSRLASNTATSRYTIHKSSSHRRYIYTQLDTPTHSHPQAYTHPRIHPPPQTRTEACTHKQTRTESRTSVQQGCESLLLGVFVLSITCETNKTLCEGFTNLCLQHCIATRTESEHVYPAYPAQYRTTRQRCVRAVWTNFNTHPYRIIFSMRKAERSMYINKSQQQEDI